MLGVVGSSLKLVKFEPTAPDTSQHIATGRPNARNMFRPTMLRYVALACCDRLAGAQHKFTFHLFPTLKEGNGGYDLSILETFL